MRILKRFFVLFFCVIPVIADANVATTAGSNLTAWNGDSGSTNNNNWNQLMNNRSQATGPVGVKPKADFGNCNSLILRCAQPKCAGCTTMDIARTIVSGCVNSNDSCKKHGDDLVEFISAQIVADANAKMQQQQLAAQNAAAQAAAAQNSAQLQQMQQQMQQMQYEMQQQNALQMQQMQAALDEQKSMAAQAQAQAAAAASAQMAASVRDDSGLSQAQIEAAEKGVDADVLVRQQISGQIMSKIENAEVALKSLQATMQDAFSYAGCDTRGNNCVGPKRVKTFKQKAMGFFQPYNDVLDELYDALIIAQSVGVDITDIYMMLNGACNVWGEYLCSDTSRNTYSSLNCKNGRSVSSVTTNGGAECVDGQVVPAEDSPACVLQKTLSSSDDVQRSWLDSAEGSYDSSVRIGCASAALESSGLFANRKKKANVDIETLERIIEQDAPASLGGYFDQGSNNPENLYKYCAVNNEEAYLDLQKAVSMQVLPKVICVKDSSLTGLVSGGGVFVSSDNQAANNVIEMCKGKATPMERMKCQCNNSGQNAWWVNEEQACKCQDGMFGQKTEFNWNLLQCQTQEQYNQSKSGAERNCKNSDGRWNTGSFGAVCECPDGKIVNAEGECVDAGRADCEASGGTWSGSACDCKSGYDLVNKKCVLSSEVMNLETRCTLSGGTWLSGTGGCLCKTGQVVDVNGYCKNVSFGARFDAGI